MNDKIKRNIKYKYITPYGEFTTQLDASKASNISLKVLRKRLYSDKFSEYDKIIMKNDICLTCGEKFIPKSQKQKFCSKTCAGIHSVGMKNYKKIITNNCQICGIKFKKDNKNNSRTRTIDHEHSTNKFRGILCSNCNRAIGLFYDNIESLKRATEYLENFYKRLKIYKTRNVKTPNRSTLYSAGYDLYIPKFDKKFLSDLKKFNAQILDIDKNIIYIKPNERILIPSGFHINIPHGYALFIKNKSGIASKRGFDRLAEVIDSDYQGEVFLNLVNTSNMTQTITEGEKILQMTLMPVIYPKLHEIETLEKLYPEKTERGDGAFGSTGHK